MPFIRSMPLDRTGRGGQEGPAEEARVLRESPQGKADAKKQGTHSVELTRKPCIELKPIEKGHNFSKATSCDERPILRKFHF